MRRKAREAAPETVALDQPNSRSNDFCFGPLNQGRVKGDPRSFNSPLSRQISHGLVGLNILRPTIRVTAVVQRVDTNEDVICA